MSTKGHMKLKIFVVYSILNLSGVIWYCLLKKNFAFNYKNYVAVFGELSSTSEFEDKYFKRILASFKGELSFTPIENFTSGSMPVFLLIDSLPLNSSFWRSQLNHISLNKCPLPCKYTADKRDVDKVDAVLIYIRHISGTKFMKANFPKRNLHQPWAMLTFEAPLKAKTHSLKDYSIFNNLFNRTIMFRKDADVIVSHGFIVSKKDAEYLPYDWRIPPEDTNSSETAIITESKVVATISNCRAKSGRLSYVDALQQHIRVDVYGKCGPLKCGHSMYVAHNYKTNTNKCFQKFGKTYMFYLAFENSICKDYGSEKIYNLLYYRLVPVVLGGINYQEILPPHSFINAAEYSPADLAKHLKFLIENPEEYEKYHEWRNDYLPSTIGGERIVCDICTQLYNPRFYDYNIVEDFNKWFLLDSKCYKQWTIDNKYNLSYYAT